MTLMSLQSTTAEYMYGEPESSCNVQLPTSRPVLLQLQVKASLQEALRE